MSSNYPDGVHDYDSDPRSPFFVEPQDEDQLIDDVDVDDCRLKNRSALMSVLCKGGRNGNY